MNKRRTAVIELTEEYLTTSAEDMAKTFISDNIDKSQIRKFYDDFKLIERKMLMKRGDPDIFKKELLPLIKFEKSKIAYAAGRKKGRDFLVSKGFKTHMDAQIDRIQTEEGFRNFLQHYQAIIAYFTYFRETGVLKNDNRGKGGRR